jgi:hypothetical protein
MCEPTGRWKEEETIARHVGSVVGRAGVNSSKKLTIRWERWTDGNSVRLFVEPEERGREDVRTWWKIPTLLLSNRRLRRCAFMKTETTSKLSRMSSVGLSDHCVDESSEFHTRCGELPRRGRSWTARYFTSLCGSPNGADGCLVDFR